MGGDVGKRQFISAIVLAAMPTAALGIDISTVGSWTETVDAADLISGAGSDLVDTYESTVNEVVITVLNTTGSSDNWRVDVRRSDTTWSGSFVLWVERTGAGTGAGSISGGTTYQEVTTIDATFFSGAGDRNGVDIRLRLTGMSVSASPNNYLSSVIYTVVDTP